MNVMESGIMTEMREVQKSNPFLPMTVIEFGIQADVKSEQE